MLEVPQRHPKHGKRAFGVEARTRAENLRCWCRRVRNENAKIRRRSELWLKSPSLRPSFFVTKTSGAELSAIRRRAKSQPASSRTGHLFFKFFVGCCVFSTFFSFSRICVALSSRTRCCGAVKCLWFCSIVCDARVGPVRHGALVLAMVGPSEEEGLQVPAAALPGPVPGGEAASRAA